MDQMKKMDIYRTDDRGIAAYALLLGYTCIGCIPANHTDSRRMDFVFIDVPDPKVLETDWYRGYKIMMSPRAYFTHMTTAVRMTKEPLTREEVERLRG